MNEQNRTAAVTEATSNGDFEMTTHGSPRNNADQVGEGTVGGGIGLEDVNSAFGGAEEERAAKYPRGKSTAAGAVANLVNTIVGAGIVGLPYALAQSGLWAGIFMMCLAAFLTNMSTKMLVVAGEKVGLLNYEELMANHFGNFGLYVYSFFVAVLAFGAMSAYLIIVGDTIPEMVQASGVTSGPFAERESVIALFGIFIVLPLSLLKDLSKLSLTSGISVTADLLLTLIVIFAGAGEASDNPEIDTSERFVFIRSTIFAGFGAISFAFVSQSASFLVYRSMAKGGLDRWTCVTTWSTLIALAMGLALSLGGYLNFVNKTEGNILNNFSTDHKPASAARAFLALTMVFTYPMEMYVTRHVLDTSIFQTMLGQGPITRARHYGLTIGLWTLTMILSLSTDQLGSILEIFGALGASIVGYVLPALLFMKVNKGEVRRARAVWRKGTPDYESALGERLWASRRLILPVFMVAFGVVATVAGLATAICSELSPTKA